MAAVNIVQQQQRHRVIMQPGSNDDQYSCGVSTGCVPLEKVAAGRHLAALPLQHQRMTWRRRNGMATYGEERTSPY